MFGNIKRIVKKIFKFLPPFKQFYNWIMRKCSKLEEKILVLQKENENLKIRMVSAEAENKKLQEGNSEKLRGIETEILKLKESFRKDIQYCYYKSLHPDLYEEALKEWFIKMTGEKLDLKNPISYNQKIQWLKLYDSTPLKTKLADKYLVRGYVENRVGGGYIDSFVGSLQYL